MDYELIENYLEGKLEGEQLQQFEHRLQTDAAFAETVRLYKNIEREMKAHEGEPLLKEQLLQLNKKHFGTPIAKTVSIKRIWYLAGAVAAVVAAAIFLIPMLSGPSRNARDIFAGLLTKDSLPSVVRGTTDSLRIAIAQEYNNQQYAAALPLLEQYAREHPTDAVYNFAKAVCYTETGNQSAAIRDLDPLINGSSIYKYKAIVLKAFILFQQQRIAETVELLKIIPPNAPEYKQAQQLIGKLQ